MMKKYAALFYWYESVLGKIFRFCILLTIVVWWVMLVRQGHIYSFVMSLLYLFVMIEIFFQYKIARLIPQKVTELSLETAEDGLTMLALAQVTVAKNAGMLMSQLSSYPQVQFILTKVGITSFSSLNNSKDAVVKKAYELVIQNGGTYITTMDLCAAYLLLLDEEKKVLFEKEIKPSDLLLILSWAHRAYPVEEHPQPLLVHFRGEGLGEALVSGWTYETRKYTRNFTYQAFNYQPFLIGREKEYELVKETLVKHEHNNVLLVGDIGGGKENIVIALAQASVSGEMTGKLKDRHILELLVGLFIAGAANRSDQESRLQAIIDEVLHAGDVILYIPELQNIMGASSYNIDLSGALLPYLKDGKLPIIATMTPGNYKVYGEKNPLLESFEIIHIDEPTPEVALVMLEEKSQEIEQKYAVLFSFLAIKAAVHTASRFLQDAILPGSAVQLLEEAASRTVRQKATRVFGYPLVTASLVTTLVEEKTHIKITAPQQGEKNLLLHLETKLHERVIGQDKALAAVSEALRRLRSGMHETNKPIAFLFLGPTGVGKTETAKALASLYYGGEENMLRFDMSEYADTSGVTRLLGALPGQGDERGELTDKIHDHPASLVLLDEFEKAHPKILDLFLQVFEDGRLTDNKGRTVSFVNSIIIATSNAGATLMYEQLQQQQPFDATFQQKLMDFIQTQHLFKPELLNRFDEIVTFLPLTEEEVAHVVQLLLTQVTQQLAEKDITLRFEAEVVKKIVAEGYDRQFGARPLRRYIQETIEDLLAKKSLADEIKRGDTVTFHVDASGMLTTVISQ